MQQQTIGREKEKKRKKKKRKKRVRILGKKYVSVFWALSGHCLDIDATITGRKTWKLSSLDLTGHSVEGIFVQMVSFFCRHYFVLFLPSFDEVHVQPAWAQ